MRSITFISLFLVLSIQSICAQIATIPFHLQDNGHIHLDMKLNDLDRTLNFVFDTGATADVLDAKIAKELGLDPDYQQSVTGGSGAKTYDIVLNQKLIVAPNIIVDRSNLVLTDLTPFHELSDRPFDGIIGYSLLRRYITKIDYEKKELVLYKSMDDIDMNGYSKIPFHFGRGVPIPQFDISITLQNGEEFTGRILFDSGAGMTLSVNSPYKKDNKFSEKAEKTIVSKSQSLGHESVSEQIAITSLKIGDFEFNDLCISLSNDKSGVSAYKNYLGILGAKVIQRFTIVLDYDMETLYLKKNGLYDTPFEFPMSGIRLKRKEGKIYVNSIASSCPAYQKGLREGDQILDINGVAPKSIRKYYKLLKQEGKLMTVKVLQSSGQQKTFSFTLKRLL